MLQCFSIEGFCSKIFSAGSLEKSNRAGVCVYVYPSVQAFSILEPKQRGRSGREIIRSMRRNGRKTIVTFSDQSVACGRCHVQPIGLQPLPSDRTEGCRTNQWTDSTQTWWADGHYRGTKSVWGYDGTALLARATGTCQFIS